MNTTANLAGTWLSTLLLWLTLAPAPAFPGEADPTIDLGPTTARAITYDHSLTHDPCWSPDGRWIVYVSDAEGPDGVRRERLWIAPATGDGPHRRLTSGHDGDEEFTDYYPAWSPDGKRIAFTSNRGGPTHIWVVPAAGGQPRQVTRIPLGVNPSEASSRWSPDGRVLAFTGVVDGDDTEVLLLPVDGGERTRLTFDATRNSFPDWSPDGRQLAYVSARGGAPAIWIHDLDGTASPRPLETGLPEGSIHFCPRYSPDGRWIAFQARVPSDRLDAFATTWVVPATGGRAVQVTPAGRMSAFVPSWSPDGFRLAVTGYAAPDVYLATTPADSGAVLRLASAAVNGPAWSPDGSRLAYVTDGGQLAVVPSTGGAPRIVVPADRRPRGPSWSPDGESLAFAMASADGQSCNVYTSRLGDGSLEPVTIGRQWVWGTAWSPDGEDIAFLSSAERGVHSDVWIVSAYGGRPRRLSTTSTHKGALVWLDGGRQIGFAEQHVPGSGARWDLKGIDPRGGYPQQLLLQPQPPFTAVLPDPTGRRALFAGAPSGMYIANLPQGIPRSLGVRGMAPDFSPDGGRVAFIAGEVMGFNIWTIDVRPLLSAVDGPEL